MRHSSYRITRHGPIEAPESARLDEPFVDVLWTETGEDVPDQPVRLLLRRGNPDSIDPQVGKALEVYPDELDQVLDTLEGVKAELRKEASDG